MLFKKPNEARWKSFDFYRTKTTRKWDRKFRRKYIEICENFEWKLTKFVRSLSQISFNKNFDGNPSFFLLFCILLTWNANSIAWWIDRFCVCKYSHFTGRASEKWKGYYQSLIQPTPPNLFSRTIRLIGEDSAIPFLWLCSALKKYLTQSLER